MAASAGEAASAKRVKVQVSFSNLLCGIAGSTGEEVFLPPGATVSDLVRLLGDMYGDDFRSFLWAEPEKLRSLINIYVNRQTIKHLDGLQTQLPDQSDVLVFFEVRAFGGG